MTDYERRSAVLSCVCKLAVKPCKLLDRSFIYGYCGNDYRIIEVSYNDGSIATYCITGEDYAELMN